MPGLRFMPRCLGTPLVLLAVCSLARAAEPLYKLQVLTDHQDHNYVRQEDVVFQIQLLDGRQQPLLARKISYRISKDGVGALASGEVTTDKKAPIVTASIDEPGFIRCDATCQLEDGSKLSAAAAGAVEPLRIAPSLPAPPDFDKFWQQKKAEFETIALEAVLTPVDSPEPHIECLDVQVRLPGTRNLSAYYARPIGAKPRSLPAILYLHGAGVRSSQLSAVVAGANFGAIAMDFNAHGLPNGQSEAYYKALSDGELLGVYRRNPDDPEKIYFLSLFRRMYTALRFITSQEQWDGHTLIVYGSSQGGGQALAAAALEPRVTLCCASVPAICDHSGPAAGRVAGWPKLVPIDSAGHPEPRALELARYYDCMNFARRIGAQVLVSVGFIDRTSPPTSVYAAYNNIASEKRIITAPLMDHAFPPEIISEFNQAVRQHIAARRAAAAAR